MIAQSPGASGRNLTPSFESGERLHALDAVRGGALLAGVLFHAAMSFMEPRFWIVGDSATDPALNLVFFVLHMFRMTLFFVIAGFFARLLLHRRGLGGFAADRAKRIAAPLAIFWLPSIVAIVAIAIWSFAAANGGTIPADAPPPPPPTLATFPLTHLWFLYALILLYVLALAVRGVVALIDRGGALRRGIDTLFRLAIKTGLAPVVFAAPAFAAVLAKPDWIMWYGIPTPDAGFVPNLPATCAYTAAFAFGWLLQRQSDLLGGFARYWPLNLGAALVFTGAGLWLAGIVPQQVHAESGWRTTAFAGAYLLGAWAWTFALIGLAMRFLSKHSPLVRYVSDASYWIYIVHLPLVMAGQVLVLDLPMPALAKYALIVFGALAIGFSTYHLLVRFSFIGALLNGRKHRRAGKRSVSALAAAE